MTHEDVIFSKKDPQVLVLGVGNILMGDEGVGVRVVEKLQKNYHFPDFVEVVDGGTSGVELLGFIENKDLVIIVDAVQKEGTRPGDVILIDLSEHPGFYRTKISPHQLGISDLLNISLLSDTMPERIKLIGIVPENLEPGLDLSESVVKGMERGIRLLKKLLKDMNIELLPK